MAKRSSYTATPSGPGEEHDTAIFAAGKKAKEAGEEENNPYAEDTPQFAAWAAGYAEGEAPDATPETPEGE